MSMSHFNNAGDIRYGMILPECKVALTLYTCLQRCICVVSRCCCLVSEGMC